MLLDMSRFAEKLSKLEIASSAPSVDSD